MTYVDNRDIDTAVYYIIETVVKPNTKEISDKAYTDMADTIKSIIGRFTGIRREDGKDRFYDVTLLEGEDYVMDG